MASSRNKQYIILVILAIGSYFIFKTAIFQELFFPANYWTERVQHLEAEQKQAYEMIKGVKEELRVLSNKRKLGVITQAEFDQEYSTLEPMFDSSCGVFQKISDQLQEARNQLEKQISK
jgi:hypothetical protein